ncbi:MAG TPA: AglZ/HisF2 family acetamidino modification protein, partial [Pyrinomonadaceae bacterium]|nr:AglZ/HisF2 family acetamidino modification protein [Pyrinomonadaceae bacterium]
TRVIPCLLLKNEGLVKTVKFKNPKYVGDPLNAVKIFNEKEVDELIFLDITATVENRRPPLKLISQIASECFMPFCYGGGIRSVEDIAELFKLGVEKVAINSQAVENPLLIRSAAEKFGSQSIVVSIDVKKNLFGKYRVFTHGGRKATKFDPAEFAARMQEMGAGELFLNSIDRDGTMQGYDLELTKKVTESVSLPVIACGGAGRIEDFADAIKKGGASAVSAGSMFVFQGQYRAVLITYPSIKELELKLNQ